MSNNANPCSVSIKNSNGQKSKEKCFTLLNIILCRGFKTRTSVFNDLTIKQKYYMRICHVQFGRLVWVVVALFFRPEEAPTEKLICMKHTMN